jgi:RNA polymerase sigma-70 factor (ECF subfamily)
MEASSRLGDYLERSQLSPFLWLRLLTMQQLLVQHRKHMGTRMRDAGREVSLQAIAWPEASSEMLAHQLLGESPTPLEAAMKAELQLHLQNILDGMEPLDREILILRHFEQLTNTEAAELLELTESAASKRYVRALLKLKDILAQIPGFSESL